MKVLIVCYHPPSKGGLGINTYLIAQGLKNAGIDVCVASTENYPGLKTHIFKKYGKSPFFSFNEKYLCSFLIKIIKKQKIDLIHVHDRLTSLGALKAGKKIEKPVIVHFLDYWFACPKGHLLTKDLSECSGIQLSRCLKCILGKGFLWNFYKYFFLIKKAQKKLDQAQVKIVESEQVKQILMVNKIKRNIFVVPDPVKNDFFKSLSEQEKHEVKEKYDLKQKVVSYFGELTVHKGVFNLMQIIKNISDNGLDKNTSFLIAGWGDLEKYCQNFIKENKLKNVILTYVDKQEIKKLYAVSDVVLIPSICQDPFPRVAQEAMAQAKPIIGSDMGGLKGLIEHNKTGFLLKPSDLRVWEKTILDLLNNPDLKEKMGENAKEKAQEFKQELVIQKIVKIYHKVNQI